MMYECIEDFELEEYDEDGFSTDEYMTIKKGSKWEIAETKCILGGEIHLDEVDGTKWIEILKETLNGYFRETTASQKKKKLYWQD